jgi:ankyrin repeat protein
MTREERDRQVGGGSGGSGGSSGSSGGEGEGEEGKEEEDPRDNVVVLEMVRKYEPDVELFTKSGLSPLILACGDGLLAVVEYLLDAFQCDPNSQNDTGFAPLHAAARGGHDAIVMCLLRHGADLSIEDLEGWNSLHFAAKAGHATTCGTLVREGGKDLLSIKNVRGESAARVAFKWGKSEVLETLSYYEEE